MFSDPRATLQRLHGLGDVMHAQHVGAPLARPATLRRASRRDGLASSPPGSILAMKLLREAPTITGWPSSRRMRPTAFKQRQIVRRGSCRSRCRDRSRSVVDAGACSCRHALGEKLDHLGDDVVIARIDLHGARLALHVHQHHRPMQRRRGFQRAGATQRIDVVPDGRAGGDRRAATAGFMVSMEIGALVDAPEARDHRHDAGDLFALLHRSAPGRVDSPPISMSRRRPPAWRAPGRGPRAVPIRRRRRRISGVTLSTPMM